MVGVRDLPTVSAVRTSRPSEASPTVWTRLEPWLIGGVILHTLAVGAGLLFFTTWATRFGGWGTIDPLFFPRQGGAFHFVVALAYALDYRRGSVTILVATKAIAFVFLMMMPLFEAVPWAVTTSGVLDGAMGLAVAFVHARRTR